MESGILNLDISTYLSLNRVSNSYLSRLAKIPAMAKIKTEPTPAMLFGTAFHTYTLEPDNFSNQIAVCPKCDRRTKAGKEIYADFVDNSIGKIVIGLDDFTTIQNMRNSIEQHPAASDLLSKGVAEQSVLFTDDETGLECKTRPDWITGSTIVDLKKTRDASERGFMRAILQFRYHQQAAMYLTAMEMVSDTTCDEFVFIAVCDQPPYQVECYRLSDDFLEFGYSELKRLFKLEKRCRVLDFYPNYQSEGIIELKKPAYLY